jgi:hypothetical protein
MATALRKDAGVSGDRSRRILHGRGGRDKDKSISTDLSRAIARESRLIGGRTPGGGRHSQDILVVGFGKACLGEVDIPLDQAQCLVIDLVLVAQLDERSALDLQRLANEMVEMRGR